MRSRAIHCCSYVILGLFVRTSFGVESTNTPLLGEQELFSISAETWKVIVAIGILAGLINLLARQKNREALGIEIPAFITTQPLTVGFGLVALMFVALSFTSLPSLPLIVLAELFVLLAWTNYQKVKRCEDDPSNPETSHQKRTGAVTRGSILKLELGSSLLGLASQDLHGNLVDQLTSLRVTVLDKLGITLPPIHIKDNLKLPANSYRIYLRGGILGEGTVYKDRLMVVSNDEHQNGLDGIVSTDPVFGLPALWITEEVREDVGELFVQAMDPVAVLMTHLSTIIEKHASELLSREEVSEMVNELREVAPRLVNRVIGKTISLSRLHHILTSLLEERVSVKDLATVIETCADGANLPVEECVEMVRATLRRQICANISRTGLNGQQIIRCIELPAVVEIAIANKLISKKEISEQLHHAAIPLIAQGLPIVVLVSPAMRRQVKDQMLCCDGDVHVFSKSEIVPEVEVQVVGTFESTVQEKYSSAVLASQEDKHQTITYAKSLLECKEESSVIENKIELGIAEIRTLVGEVLEYESAGRLSPLLTNAHRSLVSRGIDEELAYEIVQQVDFNPSLDNEVMQRQLTQELIKRLPRAVPPPNRETHEPTIIALVGPTGVGKTTTIAKLATKFRLQQGRSVAMVTADTYRIAAIDQLQQYAELFDSTLKVAGTAEQMRTAIASCRQADIVLIDTAGRSAADGERIQETADILQIANPNEIHLVLSAATSRTATKKAVESYSRTRYDRIIVTKLDEVMVVGEMVSSLCFMNKPMSWFTNGQDISTHIDLARPSKLVESIWSDQRPITI